MKKMMKKFAVAVFALSAFWGSQANALEVFNSGLPDIQIFATNTVYSYSGGSLVFEDNGFVLANFKDGSTPSGVNYFNVDFDITLIIDSSGVFSALGSSFTISGKPSVTDPLALLLSGNIDDYLLVSEGTKDSIYALSSGASLTGGTLASAFAAGAGFIINGLPNLDFNGGDILPTAGVPIDISTPAAVPVPGPLYLLIFAMLPLVRLAARSKKG